MQKACVVALVLMKKFFYDLHIHSCLSPCADNDMTVNNIAGMAKLNGLQIVALTDHNSTKNCTAFYWACEKNDLVAIAGVELTTAEDIHFIVLFETLEDAARFDEALQEKRILIKNRPDVAGEQLILDENDNIVGTEEHFLPNATTLSLEQAYEFVKPFNAVIYPAHIDRTANGIVAVLGAYPQNPDYLAAEFHDRSNIESYVREYSKLLGVKAFADSDAHYLWNISEAENFIKLDCDDQNSDDIRKAFFDYLRRKDI